MPSVVDTKDEILERAAVLLQTRGFNGFSYKDIAQPMGVKNAAIHYHFPSKADLAMALVNRYLDILKGATAEFMAYGGSATKQLEGLIQFTLSECENGRIVCPAGSMAVDFDSLPEDVKTAVNRFHNATIKWLTRVLELGREQGELRYEGSADSRALALLSSVQGARKIGRLMGIDAVRKILEQEKRSLMPMEAPISEAIN